jgi:hypothetical protein
LAERDYVIVNNINNSNISVIVSIIVVIIVTVLKGIVYKVFFKKKRV